MRILTIISFLLLPMLCMAQEVLTNADVVKLSTLLPPSTVVSKIHNSPTHFDVSIDALVALKSQGVSGEVINEMITANVTEQQTAANKKNLKDPRTMHPEGIYYYNQNDSANRLLSIDPSTCTAKSLSAGRIASEIYTGGLAKSRQWAQITGTHAHRQIPQSKPYFYFYFTTSKTSAPNEYALVRLKEKGNSREMSVGKTNTFGGAFVIEEKERVQFDYELISQGVYRVQPKATLEPGEYCFINTTGIPTAYFSGKVFDFQITVVK